MVLKLKPKKFGPVYVSYDGSEKLIYALGDDARGAPYPPDSSPVDTLIAALGSCIVKSIQWSADQHKVDLNPFQVEVIGIKSTQLPARVEKVNITVIGDFVQDAALSTRILKQAKSICTVSNSLNSSVAISARPKENG